MALLDDLRRTGVEVLYSSELVPPMLLAPEPGLSLAPLERVRSALAARDLALERVSPAGAGRARYVVTRLRPAGAPVPAAMPAMPTVPTPHPSTPALAEVSVYASRYALGTDAGPEAQLLSSLDIQSIPGTQIDALRATRVLPGLATGVSARPYIRGSLLDDVLVQFDGIPLTDPFHLKNFQSGLSAFDHAVVDGIEVFSGGFPVRYGGRSGGVIDIAAREIDSGYEHSVGASLFGYEAASVGRAAELPLDWLVSARHSASDLVLRPLPRNEGDPRLADSLGRLRWHLGEAASLTVGWLLLDDRVDVSSDTTQQLASARYRDQYGWLAFEHGAGTRLHQRTLLVATDAERSRDGSVALPGIATGKLAERRDTGNLDLRSNWDFAATPDLDVSFGFEIASSAARSSYSRLVTFTPQSAAAFGRPLADPLAVAVDPHLSAYSAFASVRRRWPVLDAELGLRWDEQDYRGFGRERELSPRLNLRHDFPRDLRAYGSWGRFAQAQRPDEWQLEDAQVTPHAASIATHAILGLAWEPRAATAWRLEAYRKRWSHVLPYFDNLLDPLSLLPDLQPDRVRIAPVASEADGVELSARREFTPTLAGWASYAWSRVADQFGQGDVLRSWDQTSALTTGLGFNGARANASIVLGWHSGWPRTPFVPATLALGARNSGRWNDYLSVDLRAGWKRPLAHGELATWLEITNATDRHNDCCQRLTGLDATSGGALAERAASLPLMLNVGFEWRLRGPR